MCVYHQAFLYVLGNEGGVSNHPSDRGGETKYGITTATAKRHGFLRATDVTLTDASNIYHEEYWPVADPIAPYAPRVAIKVFDTAVVSGPGRALRLLQRALSALGYYAKEDGTWGPKTNDALSRAIAGTSEDVVLQQIALELSAYVLDIVQARPAQKVFLKGWLNRARLLPPFLPRLGCPGCPDTHETPGET